jgi:hypothetical protein
MEEFRVIKGIPMEKERVEASPEEIEAYLAQLARIFEAFCLPAGMVVNIDETGHQCWVDAHKESVIVPIGYLEDSIPIPVTRNEKRATLLGGISAAGDMLEPLVIVPRVTIERELMLLGGENLHVVYQPNGFVTAELFEQWCVEVLFKYFRDKRETLGYAGPGLLILDGCSCHKSDEFWDACNHHGIIPVLLPPHSSDQLQPLDLGIFALQKAEATRMRPGQGLNPQTVQVLKILGGYGRATCPNIVISAFQRGGIETYLRDVYSGPNDSGSYLGFVKTVRINREKATKVRQYDIPGKRVNVRGGVSTNQPMANQEAVIEEVKTAVNYLDSDDEEWVGDDE